MPIDFERDVVLVAKPDVQSHHFLDQAWGPGALRPRTAHTWGAEAQKPKPAQSREPDLNISDFTLRPLFVGAVSGSLHAVSRYGSSSRSLIVGLGVATGTFLYQVGKYEWNKYLK